jgi:hypothetical protein
MNITATARILSCGTIKNNITKTTPVFPNPTRQLPNPTRKLPNHRYRTNPFVWDNKKQYNQNHTGIPKPNKETSKPPRQSLPKQLQLICVKKKL